MILGRKIRLYPTKEQEQLMWKHIGSCRFIYNYMLDIQIKRYQNGEKYLSEFDMNKLLTPLKKESEYSWLNEISTTSLQRICGDLSSAYQNLFSKRAKKPKFKSKKKSKKVYPTRSDRLWFDEKGFAHIEKIGKVKFKTDYNLPIGTGNKFNDTRISNVNGKWILSFGLEVENQDLELNDISMGIDLGIKESAIAAYGIDKIVLHNINKSRQMRLLNKKLKHLQRSVSRKYEANKIGNKYNKTNNIIRVEDEIRKTYARISNIRNNYIHQSTKSLIMMRPNKIIIEDLNVSGAMRNRHLSKAIQEQCWYEWRRQLEYKCKFYGIPLIVADRFYPSSKTCYCCKHIKKDLKLSDRVYKCPECGFEIDRDFNAALNLMSYEDYFENSQT